MTPAEKKTIDNMDYYSMLSQWRFAPIGDPYFSLDRERSEYFANRMFRLKEADPTAAVTASKTMGW